MATEKHALVIVESPSKARTLQNVLGGEYHIAASVGHIRDLPKREMGVDTDHDFQVTYQISPDKKKVIAELKKAVKQADVVYLATDPDREGEAISWHLTEILDPTVPTYRLVFHEVTQEAIRHAFDEPRDIDMRLVRAQETRRILDRLVGYELSPLLWRKIAPRLSAGRVQSVAIRLVVERERARLKFKTSAWWDIAAKFATTQGETFTAALISAGGQRLVNGKDFDRTTGELKDGAEKLVWTQVEAVEWAEKLCGHDWRVTALEEKPSQSNPWPPFTTSTLQQEAYRKLRFSAKRTMQVAQRLYESGYITYMRTDSTSLSREALAAARGLIKQRFGPEYLPPKARIYKTKVKNAQEAHEAIRPAGSWFRDPGELTGLDKDMQRLYDLIYRRTLACQMAPARIRQTTAEITDDEAVFQATGKVVEFPGYLAAYQAGRDDGDGDDKTLPPLTEGEAVQCEGMEPKEHETKPPARYTEATLIKEMESLGIGRPSTYASIMDTIQRREYVVKQKGALVPTFIAVAVVRLMERYFTDLVDYQFTARMEDVLDEISRGEREALPYLQKFYFGHNGDQGLKDLLGNPIDSREVCTIRIGEGEDEVPVLVRVGRYGPYLEYGDVRTNLDLETPPAELSLEQALELIRKGGEYPKELGTDPATELPVLLKKGRYGFYLQLGDNDHKQKQKSLLPGMQPEEVNLDVALDILSLPRELGMHPETGEAVLADLGRYGPYLKSGSTNRRLPKGEDLLTIELERAVEILAKGGGRAGATVLRPVGQHPATGVDIVIKEGRYGPYITDGKTNVSLKKGEDPESVELADAVERLAAKAAQGPTKRRYPRRKKSGR
ncbi:MAG: type I DNA topoisomerase [Fidelibacterota bacterium]|nr:MAG: type I DNA topoisomerase [Candidatus Neomarinimicrobiota bacterium]